MANTDGNTGNTTFDELVFSLAAASQPDQIVQLLAKLPEVVFTTWGISHDCDGHQYDCLLDQELPLPDRKTTAIALIRAVVDTDAEDHLSDAFRPRMYALFDDVLSADLYAVVGVQSNEQNYAKRGKLRGLFAQVDRDFVEINRQARDLSDFNSYRQNVSAFFGSALPLHLLPPFLPRAVITTRLQRLFGDVDNYAEQSSNPSPAIFDACLGSIQEFVNELPTSVDEYGKSFINLIVENLERLVRGHFEANPASKAATISFSTTPKKYPLSFAGATFEYIFGLSNDGPGYAEAITVAYEPPKGCSSLRGEVMVGDLAPGESLQVALPVNVDIERTISDVSLSMYVFASWQNLDGSSGERDADLALRGQRTDINWSEIGSHSPYSLDPVATSSELIGRQEQLDRLASLLHGASVGSAIVYGQRRVGKTSVVRTFESSQSLDPVHPAEVLFIDSGEFIHSDATVTVDNLVKILYQQLSYRIPEATRFPAPQPNGALSAISPFLDAVASLPEAHKVLVIIDEFDSLPYELFRRGGEHSVAFFATLRAISNKPNYGFILVGGETMRRIEDQSGERLNRFESIQLNHIDRERSWSDFGELVRRPSANVLDFSDDALVRLYELTSGHPYYTKMLCQRIFSDAVRARDTSVTASEVETVATEVVANAQVPAFQHYWTDGLLDIGERQESVTLTRKIVLLAFAEAIRTGRKSSDDTILELSKKYPVESTDVVNELSEFRTRQILDRAEDDYQCRVPLFEKWLVSVGPRLIVTTFPDPEAVLGVIREDELQRVDETEIAELVAKWELFRGDRIGTTDVAAWLAQFGEFRYQRLMFKLLGRLKFYTDAEVRSHMRNAHLAFSRHLEEYITRSGERRRDIAVSSLGGEGKSGTVFANLYRSENRIFHKNVVGPARLLGYLQRNVTAQAVVFVDDFIGTGRSLVSAFRTSIENTGVLDLIRSRGMMIGFASVACSPQAVGPAESFVDALDCESYLYVGDQLSKSDIAFDSSAWNSPEERALAESIAKQYGERLEKKQPLGFGGIQSLVVFPSNCPNNTLPIFWKTSSDWKPLFPRAI